MIVPIVALVFGAVMVGLSVWANVRFKGEDRLPMQWSLSGSINWSAPRVPALMLAPTLAIVALTLFVAATMTFHPRTDQEDEIVPALAGLGGAFVAAHVFHLWLVARTLRRKDG